MTCSLLQNWDGHRFIDELRLWRQHCRLDSPRDGVLTWCHSWNGLQLCQCAAFAAPTLSSGSSETWDPVLRILWSVDGSLWHDWNVCHSVDEGKLNLGTSPLCATWTAVVSTWCWCGLRDPVMIAQWSFFVWTVVHVLPVGAEPPWSPPWSTRVLRMSTRTHGRVMMCDISTERQLVLVRLSAVVAVAVADATGGHCSNVGDGCHFVFPSTPPRPIPPPWVGPSRHRSLLSLVDTPFHWSYHRSARSFLPCVARFLQHVSIPHDPRFKRLAPTCFERSSVVVTITLIV